EAVTDLDKALEQAKTEKKLLFIQYGREKCGNCQALRGYVAKNEVKLPKDKYVYVDLNCDDRATSAAFGKNFKVEGNTLPFVVIADAEGKQLAGRSGFGSPAEYKKFLSQAASKKPAGAAKASK
ncbi:MAG: thioredoxin family protein, partial [Kiritimatiellaeota bacterium]|nr:thioredoxin family protein [Kiritimatiellota bacterium]